MLNKETMTKQECSNEINLAVERYMWKISQKDFQLMSKFGLEARTEIDRDTAIYYFEEGNFKLTKNATYIINGYLCSELTIPVLKEILDISETDDDYFEQLQLVLDTAYSKAKNKLESDVQNSLLNKYHKAINFTLAKLKENGLLDNSNPYKNDSARLRKALFYDEAMNQDFDFSSVHIINNESDTLIRGFHNYISSRLLTILHEPKTKKTPEEQVISTIDKYYNELSAKDKARIDRILTKNNNEIYLKIENSPLVVKNNKGILKYTPPGDNQTIIYQTPFGLWSVYSYGTEVDVTTHYTITGNTISDAVLIAKKIATMFKLGITPVWIANKMYLKK